MRRETVRIGSFRWDGYLDISAMDNFCLGGEAFVRGIMCFWIDIQIAVCCEKEGTKIEFEKYLQLPYHNPYNKNSLMAF